MKRLIRALASKCNRFGVWGYTTLRVVAGIGFFSFGLRKAMGFSGTVDYFAGMGIPLPELNAALALTTELLGGLLLALGLGTRVVAFPMAFTMIVALGTAHRGSLTSLQFFREPATLYLAVFLVFATMGAGRMSLDRVFGIEADPNGDSA